MLSVLMLCVIMRCDVMLGVMLSVMLSVILSVVTAECPYAVCSNAICSYAELFCSVLL